MDLLDALGDDYIAQHCLIQYQKESEEKLFRMYIADSIYYLANGKTLGTSYSDLVNNKADREEKSSEEIKESIKTGLNKILKEGGNT